MTPSPTVSPTRSPTASGIPTETGSAEVVDASVAADWVRAGRTTTVRVTIRNPGDGRTVPLEVTHDGVAVSTHSVTLRAPSRTVYEFQVAFSEPRRGPVAVAGVVAGELIVAPDSEPSSTRSETGADGGAGPAVALFALLGTAVWLGARRLGDDP